MRGGAIPLLAWGTLLLVLAIGNWVWDARPVNGAAASVATLIVYAFGAMLWLTRRESIKRGPPERDGEPESFPQDSFAAVLIGLSLGCILFGLTWATFLVYFGIGVLVLSLGRIALELRAERATRRRAMQDGDEVG
jgi:uncharacterized iron-regulated membrane protein